MTSNLNQIDKTVLEFLELQQHELMLRDQMKSIKSRMNTIQPYVFELAKSFPEKSIAVLPTPDQMNRFGEMGALRLHEVSLSEKLSRKFVAEQTKLFFHSIVPGQDALAQVFADQLSAWLWNHRGKVKSLKLQRVYAAEMEAKKAKKRKPAGHPDAPPTKKSARDPNRSKTAANIETSESTAALRQSFSQHMTTILTNFENASDQKM